MLYKFAAAAILSASVAAWGEPRYAGPSLGPIRQAPRPYRAPAPYARAPYSGPRYEPAARPSLGPVRQQPSYGGYERPQQIKAPRAPRYEPAARPTLGPVRQQPSYGGYERPQQIKAPVRQPYGLRPSRPVAPSAPYGGYRAAPEVSYGGYRRAPQYGYGVRDQGAIRGYGNPYGDRTGDVRRDRIYDDDRMTRDVRDMQRGDGDRFSINQDRVYDRDFTGDERNNRGINMDKAYERDSTRNLLGNDAVRGYYGHGLKAAGHGPGIAPVAGYGLRVAPGPKVTKGASLGYGHGLNQYGAAPYNQGYGYGVNQYAATPYGAAPYGAAPYGAAPYGYGKAHNSGLAIGSHGYGYQAPSVHGMGELEVGAEIETGREMETEVETEVTADIEVGPETEIGIETEINADVEFDGEVETGVETEIDGELEAELETEHADGNEYEAFAGLEFPEGVNGMEWNPNDEPEFKSGRAPPSDFKMPESPFAKNGFGSFGGFSNNLFSSQFNGW